jgi:putative FmdB family regulatory protein
VILYSYSCPSCEQDFDEFAPLAECSRAAPCPSCGGFSPRKITFPTIDPRLGVDPDFPTLADKWARTHHSRSLHEKKKEREHGIFDVNKEYSSFGYRKHD